MVIVGAGVFTGPSIAVRASAILRLHGLLLGPLRCLPFFRGHRRLLLAFFIRAAVFGHAVRSLSVLSVPLYVGMANGRIGPEGPPTP